MALQDNQGIDVWAPILLLVVALITFAARVYVRVTDKTFGLDDSLMSLGSFFYIFQCTTVIGGGVAGIGLRNEHITGNAQYVAAGRVSLAHDDLPFYTETNASCVVVLLQCPRLLYRRLLC